MRNIIKIPFAVVFMIAVLPYSAIHAEEIKTNDSINPGQVKTYGVFLYRDNDDGKTVTLVGVDSESEVVYSDIPSSINGKPVTIIDRETDYERLGGKLVIPDSVTSIAEQAFYECDRLTGLALGNGVTTIGESAFSGCDGLTGNLIIPNSVTTIGYGAFSGCSGLTGLTIGKGCTAIGDQAFSLCTGIESITIYSNALIEDETFWHCNNLKNLTFGDDVKEIGKGFRRCTSLENLTIGKGVTVIGEEAFEGCSGLTGELIIPDNVTTLRMDSFSGCSGLTGLTIGKGVETIENGTFSGCSNLKSVTIPGSVKKLDADVFRGCDNLTTLDIDAQTIESYAFRELTNLKSLTLGNGVKSIGFGAFKGCTGLTGHLNIPGNVQEIDKYAFNGCSGLTGLTIENGVKEIWCFSFENCSGLTGNLTIPESVTIIGQEAFCGCSGLTELTMYGNMQDHFYRCFADCYGIKKITNISGFRLNAGYFLKDTSEFLLDSDGKRYYYDEYIYKGTYVRAGSTIPVVNVKLDKAALNVFKSGSEKLNAQIIPSDASNNNVSWASSNTNVATVSQSGMVTGVSFGTATVTVTTSDGGYTASCVVTVTDLKPSATVIKSLTNTSKGIKITYGKVKTADGYIVCRSTNNGNLSEIARTNDTVYTDNTANKNGTKYTYEVTAYRSVNGKTYKSDVSPARICYRLVQSKFNSVKNNKKKALTLKWSGNSKAGGYQIQYSTDKNFKNAGTITIKSAKTTSKKITGLKKNKTYYVRIRPYKTVKNVKYYGSWKKYSKGVKIKK